MSGRVAVLPTGRIAVGRSDGIIDIWGSQSRSVLGQLHGHCGAVASLAVLPDGRLVSGGADGTIRIWNVGRRVEAACLRGHEGEVEALSVRRGGQLASSATDATVRVWDAQRCTELLVLKRPDGTVYGLSWLWGDHLGSGSERSGFLQWDTSTGQRLESSGPGDITYCAAALPQGWAVVHEFGAVRLFNSKRRWVSYALYHHRNYLTILNAVSHRMIVSASLARDRRGANHEIIVWDIFKRAGLRFDIGDIWPTGVGVLNDGTVIAANHVGELIWVDRRDGTIVERQQRWLDFDD